MNQTNGNFAYDLIDNLVKDKAMQVSSMSWTAYHKREKVVKEDGTTITYRYDAMNNRIYKKAEANGVTETTHYLRDGTGNTLAIYKNGELEELNIYGSSRLGTYNGKTAKGKRTLGNKRYELSNHLGNALVVITDNKLGKDIDNDEIADSYIALVVSERDYLAFGAIMAGRSLENEDYTYSFNGKELDPATGWQDYGFRDYNPVYKRFDRVDPLTASYPFYSPYQFAGNQPIMAIDLDGLEPVLGDLEYGKNVILANSSIVNGVNSYGENGKFWIAREPNDMKEALEQIMQIKKETNERHGKPVKIKNMVLIVHGTRMADPKGKSERNYRGLIAIPNEGQGMTSTQGTSIDHTDVKSFLSIAKKLKKGRSWAKYKANNIFTDTDGNLTEHSEWLQTKGEHLYNLYRLLQEIEDDGNFVIASCEIAEKDGLKLMENIYLLSEGRINIMGNSDINSFGGRGDNIDPLDDEMGDDAEASDDYDDANGWTVIGPSTNGKIKRAKDMSKENKGTGTLNSSGEEAISIE